MLRGAVLRARLPSPRHCLTPAAAKSMRAQRQTEHKSAALTCPEVRNTFSPLPCTGTVLRVGISTLAAGPAAGTVPLAAAFQKLRSQSSFCSTTNAEFISLCFQSLFPLLLLFLLYLALETGKQTLSIRINTF